MTVRQYGAGLFGMIGLLLAGCVSDNHLVAVLGEDPLVGNHDGGTNPSGDTDPGQIDFGKGLSGTWAGNAAVGTMLSDMGSPLFIPVWASMRLWFLVDISADGTGNVDITLNMCSIKTKTPSREVGLIVPQRIWDYVPPISGSIICVSSEPGIRFDTELFAVPQGMNLCDPMLDPMPQPAATLEELPSCANACDGAQCDEDMDGKPGVTHQFKLFGNTCEMYLSQRTLLTLNGSIVDRDTIEGTMHTVISQQTFHGSNNPICALAPSSTLPIEDCGEHKYFKLMRIEDGATCEEVMALTDCDEDEYNCDSNEVLPLDPHPDKVEDCN